MLALAGTLVQPHQHHKVHLPSITAHAHPLHWVPYVTVVLGALFLSDGWRVSRGSSRSTGAVSVSWSAVDQALRIQRVGTTVDAPARRPAQGAAQARINRKEFPAPIHFIQPAIPA